MRKIIAASLLVAMLAALVACGGDKKPAVTTGVIATTGGTEAETSTSAETVTTAPETTVVTTEETTVTTTTEATTTTTAETTEERDVEASCSCGRDHSGESAWKKYLLYPLLHVLKVGAFIFLVNFVLTAIIHSVGEDVFASFMNKNILLQPFVACLIGLIPNCASSVVITESFLGGAITFGSCVAGLCANAGMGFVVLLKNVRQWKRNLAMILFCYVISVLVGMLLNLFPLVA